MTVTNPKGEAAPAGRRADRDRNRPPCSDNRAKWEELWTSTVLKSAVNLTGTEQAAR